VLEGAAATVAEVRTWRRDSVRARLDHFDQLAAISSDGRQHPLARQRERHIDRTGCDSIALGPNALDDELARFAGDGGLGLAMPRAPGRLQWSPRR
jgi:hypothetical protein